MSIVLNEYDWAEKMIANHDLGKNKHDNNIQNTIKLLKDQI